MVTGCSTDTTADSPDTGTSATPVEGASTTPPPSAEPVLMPDGPAGEQAVWVLSQLDPAVTVDADDVTERVAAPTLAEMSAEELAGALTSVGATGPWTAVAVRGEGAAVAVTITDTTGTYLDLQVATGDSGQITTLFFAPGSDPSREPAASWEDLDELLAGTGVTHAVQVSTVDDTGLCTPVHQTGETDTALPLGSIVKIYVLGAVVTAVGDGTLTWDTDLTLTDDVKSLPSGTLQEEPTGSTVTVEQAATAMISISDNTATDLLISTVGRDAVLAAMTDMGHHDPSVNTPLLTTRDLFWLGWGAPDVAPTWTDLSVEDRQAALDQVPAGVLDIDPASVTDARWDDGLDWFATAADLCAAHATLQTMAATDAGAPVRDILSANPGVDLDSAAWPYVGFKGGSAPGDLAGSWYAETADGQKVVLSIQLATDDPLALPSAVELVDLAEDAFALSTS